MEEQESNTPNKDQEKEIFVGKEVAYYAAVLSAYNTTNFELDKSLLNISAAAIGLIITLITTTSLLSTCIVIFAAISLFFFITNIIVILMIFHKNSVNLTYLATEVQKKIDTDVYDYTARVAFVLGIMSAITFGVFVLIEKFN